MTESKGSDVKNCIFISGSEIDSACKLNRSNILYLENLGKLASVPTEIEIEDGRKYSVLKIASSPLYTDLFLQKNVETDKIRFVIVFPRSKKDRIEGILTNNALLYSRPEFLQGLKTMGARDILSELAKIDKQIKLAKNNEEIEALAYEKYKLFE